MLKLTYSNLEFYNFLREDPNLPLQGEVREGEGGEEREGKGREGGRGRIGKGGTGRDRGKEGRNRGWGGGGALNMGSAPPPRDKLWIRP